MALHDRPPYTAHMMNSEPNCTESSNPGTGSFRCKLHRRVLSELAPGFKFSVFSALDFKLPANDITRFMQTICRNDLQVHEYRIITSATRLRVLLRFGTGCGVFGYGGEEEGPSVRARLLKC
jgi:hypothetical protein